MEIKTQFVKIPFSKSVNEFAIKKLKKLAVKFDWVLNATVFYKQENDPKGKGKICEIKLSLPGPLIFAVSNEKSFEDATDETIHDLEKQLQKRKSEMMPYS